VAYTEAQLVKDEALMVGERLNDPSLRRLYQEVRSILQTKASPRFFEISDVLYGRETAMYTDFCHLTEEGNRQVAARMFQIVEKELLRTPSQN
jgi:hypothetical protein